MSTVVDPNLHKEIAQFGCDDFTQCINCGNCTAVCSLSGGDAVFPRKTIRYVQLGLKDRLMESPEPWLCYYCGECSDTCPQQANPGEIMMTLRRWLTAQYDSSGKAARLYTSRKSMWITILVSALIPLVLLGVFHIATGFKHITTDHVAINSFAPVAWVWAAVVLHFVALGWRVASNATHMSRLVLGSGEHRLRLRVSDYVKELGSLVLHYTTQKRWLECGKDHYRQWATHLLLVSGYVIMLTLVVGLLGWFQTDKLYPLYHPQRLLGYYATVALIYASLAMLLGRARKSSTLYKSSQHSDWLFPSFLLVGAITGIMVNIFRYAGWPWPTYVIYVIHIMAMTAMLDSEVGIGKWTHMIYRPLAIYLVNIKKRSEQCIAVADAASPANARPSY